MTEQQEKGTAVANNTPAATKPVSSEEPPIKKGLIATLWPIEKFERKKIFPLILMIFLMTFNYTLLRDLKDVLVMNATGGPTTILYLKLFFVLPGAVIFMLVVNKMSVTISKQATFYSIMAFFLITIGLMPILYGFRNELQPRPWRTDRFLYEHPGVNQGFKGLFLALNNWVSTLLYVISELWGTVVLSFLFWGFTNDICTVSEAKRFYTAIILFCNFSLLGVGILLVSLSVGLERSKTTEAKNESPMTVAFLLYSVVLLGCIIVYTYHWVHKNVLTDPRLYDPALIKPKKKKAKLGMMASLKIVFTSSYIGLLAILVVAYGMAINFVEIFYKKAYQRFVTDLGMKPYMLAWVGVQSFLTGLAAICFLMFIGSRAVRMYGWSVTALITPTSTPK